MPRLLMVPDQITQDAVGSAITCAAVPVVMNRKMVSIPSIVLAENRPMLVAGIPEFCIVPEAGRAAAGQLIGDDAGWPVLGAPHQGLDGGGDPITMVVIGAMIEKMKWTPAS